MKELEVRNIERNLVNNNKHVMNTPKYKSFSKLSLKTPQNINKSNIISEKQVI